MTKYDWGDMRLQKVSQNLSTIDTSLAHNNYQQITPSCAPAYATASQRLNALNSYMSEPPQQGFRRIHIIYICCGLGVIASLVFGGVQSFVQTRDANAHISQQRLAIQVQEREFALSQEQARIQDAIAKQRYQQGCVFLISSADQNSFVSINQGGDVIDGITGQPIASGTTVCDPNGGTAIVDSQGKAMSYAFTGDPYVVNDAAIASGYTIHRQTDFGNSKQATQ